MNRLLDLTENECLAFEQRLAPGDLVTAVWRCMGEVLCVAQARIVTRQPKTWVVELTEGIDGFERGYQLVVPRVGSVRYARFQRILPDTLNLMCIDIRDIPEYCTVSGTWGGMPCLIHVRQHCSPNKTNISYRTSDTSRWQSVTIDNYSIEVVGAEGEHEARPLTVIEAHAQSVHEEMIAPEVFRQYICDWGKNPRVLMPYGGDGELAKRLVAALRQFTAERMCLNYELVVCEPDPERTQELRRVNARIFAGDFLLHRPAERYHAVVSLLYLHGDFLRQFQHMWRCLAPGGMLVTPAPGDISRKLPYETLRALLRIHHGTIHESVEGLPSPACLLRVVKSRDVLSEAFERGMWTPERADAVE